MLQVDPMGIALAAAVIGAQGLSIWFFYWIWKMKYKSRARIKESPHVATGKAGEIRVLATFTGLRGLPWIALASNSLNPVLCIESRQMVFRVVRLRHRSLVDLIEVDVRGTYGTFNLIFSFRDTPLTFVANVETTARGAQALALLPSNVRLTERARSTLNQWHGAVT